MCGRYAASRRPEELIEEFGIESAPSRPLAQNWNTAPTQSIYLVADVGQKRTLMIASWGLPPSWSKDAKSGANMINARVESVAEKPSFRASFKSRRCLIPADGYYEWYTLSNQNLSNQGARQAAPKQPFYIHRLDGKALAMAGLYEHWRNPVSGELITSATIITTSAQGEIAQIHDRMPVLLPRECYDSWLAQAESPKEALLALLDVQGADLELVALPISRRVNSVRNNGSELIDAMPIEDEPLFFESSGESDADLSRLDGYGNRVPGSRNRAVGANF